SVSRSSPSVCSTRRSSFDVEAKRARASELERDASDPDLWNDPDRGRRLTQQLARLRGELDRYDALQRKLDDLIATDELLESGSDTDLERELATGVAGLGRELERVELAALLSGEYDGSDAVATIQAGAGG